MAVTVIYAVELAELESWVGARDNRRLREARDLLREAGDDEEWEPDELKLLDRLLDRIVNEGKLYEGLPAEERYYMTQLLIDLFDEYVDSEAVTEELDHPRLVASLDALRQREPALELMARAFSQGRTLGGDQILWPRDEDIDDLLPFFGYVRQSELSLVLPALERGLQRVGRTGQAAKPLSAALRRALETERDVVSFTG